MIFNTVRNTDTFLSISAAPHNETERCNAGRVKQNRPPPADGSYRHIPYTAKSERYDSMKKMIPPKPTPDVCVCVSLETIDPCDQGT